ncbi:MAG: single-stranded DNA-binding protein [Planctomycetes bacterium]|nr:single-stranded DNA-binding protein [Planctomycetota bacterium]
MPNFNKVILMGNLTRDPELRYTPSGQAVADFRLAINRRSKTQEGERRDSVTFVDVTAWGKQAEVINEYMAKGRALFVEGHLQLDEWTSQDGQRRSKLRVVLDTFQFVSPRPGDRTPPPDEGGPPPQGQPAHRQAQPPPQQQPPPPPAPSVEEPPEPFDDVPF